MEKTLRKILMNLATVFGEWDNGDWWGHGKNLGNCEGEFNQTQNEIIKLIKGIIPKKKGRFIFGTFRDGFDNAVEKMKKNITELKGSAR